MTSLSKDRRRWGKSALAFLLGGLVFLAGLVAMDGQLHQSMHGGVDCEKNPNCVIGMLDAGSAGPLTVEMAVQAPRRSPEALIATAEPRWIAADDLRRPVARGPPASFLFGR